MKANAYKFDGSQKKNLKDLPTDASAAKVKKEDILTKTEKNKEKIFALLEKNYADSREGLILVIQALDASGKDSIIKHVFSGMNPQWIHVASFKAPTSQELAHDYLWRVHAELPRRGELGIFNRSHYEDLITVQVEDIWKNYHMADRILKDSKKDFFEKRYEQVRHFEEYLYENSYRMVKVFLHVSPEEQQAQFLERIDDPTKNWKFNAGDLETASKFDKYLDCFSEVMNKTGTKHSPWYALPGDQRWFTRYLLTEILLEQLENCDPSFPTLTEQEKAEMMACREKLEKNSSQ